MTEEADRDRIRRQILSANLIAYITLQILWAALFTDRYQVRSARRADSRAIRATEAGCKTYQRDTEAAEALETELPIHHHTCPFFPWYGLTRLLKVRA